MLTFIEVNVFTEISSHFKLTEVLSFKLPNLVADRYSTIQEILLYYEKHRFIPVAAGFTSEAK
jgi:hypothetical protein